MARRNSGLRLSAPMHMTFYISVALFVLALIGHFAVVQFLSVNQFWFAIAAYIVLAAGNLLKGV